VRSIAVSIAVAVGLLVSGAAHGQEFPLGDWRAYSLMGPPGVRGGIQYVCFSGDQGLKDWLPLDSDLAKYVANEASLLSRFQLKVVNLEATLPGLSGNAPDKRADDVILYSLTAAGYQVAGRANNHGLDLGPEGVRYTNQRLADVGLRVIGERTSPVFHWRAGQSRIDITAMADVMDRPDPGHLILMLDDESLALVRREMNEAAFRIAFVHLGSASRFVSPHEHSQVDRLQDAGFDLIVCTGSHFIKGFLMERGRPVAYGIGDHMTSISYGGADTEPIGTHLVAGFDGNRLVQIFVVPFRNDLRRGRMGPLDEVAFAQFVRTLRERSISDESKYYGDGGALKAMFHNIARLRLSTLTQLRPRHFAYAARIVVRQRPGWVAAAGGLLVAAFVVVLYGRRSARLRKAKK
jgi:hypothetical protein